MGEESKMRKFIGGRKVSQLDTSKYHFTDDRYATFSHAVQDFQIGDIVALEAPDHVVMFDDSTNQPFGTVIRACKKGESVLINSIRENRG